MWLSYLDEDNYDAAIKDYTKAIKLKPDYGEAYNNRGVAYYNKSEFDCAIENYNKAMELKPNYIEAIDNRRVAYRRKRLVYYKKNSSEFGVDYSEAIRRNPDDSNAYYNRGEAFLRLKLYNRARSDLMAAKSMGTDVATLFHNFYANIADVEQ